MERNLYICRLDPVNNPILEAVFKLISCIAQDMDHDCNLSVEAALRFIVEIATRDFGMDVPAQADILTFVALGILLL